MLIPIVSLIAGTGYVGKIEAPLVVPYFTILGDLDVSGSIDVTDLTASGTVTADSVYSRTIALNGGNITSDVFSTENDTSYDGYIKVYDGPGYIYTDYWYGGTRRYRSGWSSIGTTMTTFAGTDILFAISGFKVYFDSGGQMVVGDEAVVADGSALHVVGTIAATDELLVGGLTTKDTVVTLADDGEWVGPTGKTSVTAKVTLGDNEEYATFRFWSNDSTYIESGSANAVVTDTDGKLCILDGNPNVKIKNRTGEPKTVGITMKYYTP